MRVESPESAFSAEGKKMAEKMSPRQKMDAGLGSKPEQALRVTVTETIADDPLAKAGGGWEEAGSFSYAKGDPIGRKNFLSHKFSRQGNKKRALQAWRELRERHGGVPGDLVHLDQAGHGLCLAEMGGDKMVWANMDCLWG